MFFPAKFSFSYKELNSSVSNREPFFGSVSSDLLRSRSTEYNFDLFRKAFNKSFFNTRTRNTHFLNSEHVMGLQIIQFSTLISTRLSPWDCDLFPERLRLIGLSSIFKQDSGCVIIRRAIFQLVKHRRLFPVCLTIVFLLFFHFSNKNMKF